MPVRSLSPLPATRAIPVWPLLAAGIAVRLWYAGFRQLVPDEAFYWVLSRHLQPGYLDHPPMLAVLLRLSTLALGSTEVGVRVVSIAFGFASLILLLRLAGRVLDDPKARLFLALMWLASPLFHGLAGIVTPDTPAIFFSLCGLGAGLWIAARLEEFHRDDATGVTAPRTALPWLTLGVFSGLAMLSKYTTVLLPGSVVFALLTHPRGRRELLRPWPYLAGVVALAVFSPVIYWNATHAWASFTYQLHHGLNAGAKVSHLKDFGEYVGVQILFFTPVLFALGAVAAVENWRRYRTLPLSRRVLLWAATLPWVFFAYASTRSHGEANWPAFGYFPLSLLMAEWLSKRRWGGPPMKWAKLGCAVALGVTLVMHAPEVLYQSHILRPLPRKLNDLFGWREMAAAVYQRSGGLPVVCNTHEDAGELSFYLPTKPTVWCVSLGEASRPTAFDYLPGGPDLRKIHAVMLVGGNTDEFCRRYGFVPAEVINWTAVLHGHPRDRKMVVCRRP